METNDKFSLFSDISIIPPKKKLINSKRIFHSLPTKKRKTQKIKRTLELINFHNNNLKPVNIPLNSFS